MGLIEVNDWQSSLSPTPNSRHSVNSTGTSDTTIHSGGIDVFGELGPEEAERRAEEFAAKQRESS